MAIVIELIHEKHSCKKMSTQYIQRASPLDCPTPAKIPVPPPEVTTVIGLVQVFQTFF